MARFATWEAAFALAKWTRIVACRAHPAATPRDAAANAPTTAIAKAYPMRTSALMGSVDAAPMQHALPSDFSSARATCANSRSNACSGCATQVSDIPACRLLNQTLRILLRADLLSQISSARIRRCNYRHIDHDTKCCRKSRMKRQEGRIFRQERIVRRMHVTLSAARIASRCVLIAKNITRIVEAPRLGISCRYVFSLTNH